MISAMNAMDLLHTRASNGKLGEPAPDQDSLQAALQAALRAPDHATLRPWRIHLVRGAARERLGELFSSTLERREPDAPSDMLDKARLKPMRAPVIIVVGAVVREHPKVPPVEQILSAGAAAQNILLALRARGFGAMWRTGAPAYDPEIKAAFGLGEEDAIVAFIYTGTPTAPDPDIRRPCLADHVKEWTGP